MSQYVVDVEEIGCRSFKLTFPSVRIPGEVLAWLQRQCELNCSSVNSEVIRCIRADDPRLHHQSAA
jgi:hypothetical protein